MEAENNIRLTAGEISQLWSSYMSDSMSNCILKYLIAKAEDKEIRGIFEYGLSLTEKYLSTITVILNGENFPLPIGFTDKDVHVSARRLYTDGLMLKYVKQMGTVLLKASGRGQTIASRADVRNFYRECVSSSSELLEKTTSLLLSKGLYVRPPHLSIPEQVEFVKNEGFLNGFFGDRRPLNAMEITQLFLNSMTNELGKAITIGFCQVAKDPDVKSFLIRGKDISHKQAEVLSTALKDDDLPSPPSYESEITSSTDAPFSDKLMLYHTTFLCATGIGNYGDAIAMSNRRDLGAIYTRLTAEAATYADDGTELLIRMGWLEQIPVAVDRDALIKQ